VRKLYLALTGFFLLAACSRDTVLEPLAVSLLRGEDGLTTTRLFLASNSLRGVVSFYLDGKLLVKDATAPFETTVDETKMQPGTYRASAVNRHNGTQLHLGNFYFSVESAATPLPGGSNVALPARGAFYYPWYPETWTVNGKHVFYTPTRGYYRSDEQSVVDSHVKALDYANVQVGIASWWGQKAHDEQNRIPLLLNRTAALGSSLKWALYYEKGTKSQTELQNDLAYIKANYAKNPAYARINGKPVLFVYNTSNPSCADADAWKAATQGEWYISLKVFRGYRTCSTQPAAWHQYGPAAATDQQKGYAYSVSPGFWRADESRPRLARDLRRFQENVQDMVASREPWQLVTTFNEWGEGTATESADEWGQAYLDVLHNTGRGVAPTPEPTPQPPGTVTVVASGDIACDPASSNFNGGDGTATACRQKYTAEIAAAQNPDAVLVLGDLQYDAGTIDKFQASYNLSWGKLKSITYPGIGNHEGQASGSGRGYCAYFGTAAHCNSSGSQDGAAYYSFDLGAWHIVVLNSNCTVAGGCSASSPQYQWLVRDLAAHPSKCTLATWHHPRFSSGDHGDHTMMAPMWKALQNAGAELVLSGHDHDLERFGPQDASGQADPKGIQQFIAGGGGKNLYSFGTVKANSEFRAKSYGVLKLTLASESYTWAFLSDTGAILDEGQTVCN